MLFSVRVSFTSYLFLQYKVSSLGLMLSTPTGSSLKMQHAQDALLLATTVISYYRVKNLYILKTREQPLGWSCHCPCWVGAVVGSYRGKAAP